MRLPLRVLFCLCLSVASQIGSTDLHGQCSGGTNAGALAPAPAAAWQTQAVTTGNYYTFVVPVATGCSYPTYFFSFCAADGGSAGFDSQITLLDNTGAYAGAYSDDYCGLQSYVAWTPTAAGTYRVLVSTYYCGSGNGATLAYRMQSPPPPDPNYSLLVNAANGGVGCATLTTATNGQRGCAWDIDETLNMLAPFSRDFLINLGNNPGGADGLSFVIQNAPEGRCACGLPGGALGSSGILNSVIIEIDTYLNAEDRDDGMAGVLCSGGPEPDHMDLWLNGNLNPPGGGCPAPAGARVIPAAIKLMNGAADYEIENGLNHLFRVSWTPGAPGTLTASVYDAAGVTLYGTLSYAFSPMVVLGTNTPFFGFTASTGGLNNQQSFCQVAVLSDADWSFSGEVEESAAKLNWTLGAQSQLVTLRRRAENGGWQTIFTAPTSSLSGNPQFVDEGLIPGVYEYQLSQRDGNGIEELSQVISLVISSAGGLQVFPIPAGNELNVRMPGTGQLSLVDAAGRAWMHLESVQGSISLPVAEIPAGVYIVRFQSAGRLWQERVAVIH